ncbi:PA2928 family protein [Kibdelosporangium phytohabitans]|nr:PA2928 family protein [Kibdelosporangium phytohabitans]
MYQPIRKARRRLPVLLLIPLLLFGLMFFGFSYLVSSEPDIEVQTGVGFAASDGRELVLVPYERHGTRGMFQMMTQDMFQVRLAAVDMATGTAVWDTQLSDKLVWEASVLAAGRSHLYVATDSGLVILDLRTGAEVAAGGAVTGLGEKYVAGRAAYGYDPDGRSVVAMNADGALLTIGLDSVTAGPARPEIAAKWAGVLSPGRPDTSPSATASKVSLATGEQVQLRERAVGNALVRVGADKRETPLGNVVFPSAALVVGGATPQHVLVRHNRTVNDTDPALSVVSLQTGAVTGALPIESSPERALTASNGTTAVVTRTEIATVTADGRISALTIGKTDFFGN